MHQTILRGNVDIAFIEYKVFSANTISYAVTDGAKARLCFHRENKP